MKKSFVIIFLAGSCIYFSASAQEEKLKFHSINTVGFSDGQAGGHFLFQTVNGVASKKWFAGTGFGIDYYRYRSVPVFLDGRRYFGKKGKGFAYADVGFNLSAKNKPGKEAFYYTSYHFANGLYTDIGIGYRIKFVRKSSFLMSTGYSYKEINYKAGTVDPCLVGPCPVNYNYYKYGSGRVVLKAGVDF